MSEAVISAVSWVSQFFSVSHTQGLKCPRWFFFTSVPGAWVGEVGRCSLSTWHLCSFSWAASQDDSLRGDLHGCWLLPD